MFDNPELKSLSRYVRSYLGGLKTLCVEVDGQEWKYLEGGKGEAIVFLHGGMGSKTQWRSLMQEYLPDYRVIAIDVPGLCVYQTFRVKKHSHRQLSVWLGRVLAQLRLPRVHLVGASLGATIAAYFAAHHPQQVSSLTLLGFPNATFGRESTNPDLLRDIFDADNIRTVDDLQYFYRLAFYNPPSLPKIVLRYNLREFLKYRETLKVVFRELSESRPLLMASLRQIRLPTLILHGDADRISPADSPDFWQLQIPQARYEVLSECGHMLQIERPDAVARLHRNLLRAALLSDRVPTMQDDDTGRFSILE